MKFMDERALFIIAWFTLHELVALWTKSSEEMKKMVPEIDKHRTRLSLFWSTIHEIIEKGYTLVEPVVYYIPSFVFAPCNTGLGWRDQAQKVSMVDLFRCISTPFMERRHCRMRRKATFEFRSSTIEKWRMSVCNNLPLPSIWGPVSC